MGWHADDERLFQGCNRAIRIISLSLGDVRSFQVKYWKGGDIISHVLGAGDLCLMDGNFQQHYYHRVPKEIGRGGRVNLTWRWIVEHSPGCPCGPDAMPPSPPTPLAGEGAHQE